MWVLGIELLSGRVVRVLNCQTSFVVLSCYARYTFISFGYYGRQNYALNTFVAGVIPVTVQHCVLKKDFADVIFE